MYRRGKHAQQGLMCCAWKATGGCEFCPCTHTHSPVTKTVAAGAYGKVGTSRLAPAPKRRSNEEIAARRRDQHGIDSSQRPFRVRSADGGGIGRSLGKGAATMRTLCDAGQGATTQARTDNLRNTKPSVFR